LQVHIIHPGVQQSLRGQALWLAVWPIACRSMGIHSQRVELQQASRGCRHLTFSPEVSDPSASREDCFAAIVRANLV